MPTQPKRPGRTRVAVVLALAVAVLAGCVPDARVEAPPDAPLVPSPAAPAAPSLASRCGPKPFGAEQPPNAWERFDVTAAQLEVINRRLVRVLCGQGLWRKGVGFGVNRQEDGTGWFVMIHPGFSGLTARQILDRFLGR